MSAELQTFRERAARAVANADRGCAADQVDRYTRMADAVIAEFATPTSSARMSRDRASAEIRGSDAIEDMADSQLKRTLQDPFWVMAGVISGDVGRDRKNRVYDEDKGHTCSSMDETAGKGYKR